MRLMNKMTQVITDNYNAFAGLIITLFSMVFGEHWYLFLLFLILNIADWITGWMKSSLLKKENSVKGWQGVAKKMGYWLMILVAFTASAGFIEIGYVIHVDLGVTTLLGWFVLASLIVNEIRSICENFVEAGFHVPKILMQGLEVAQKVIDPNEEEENKDGIK